MFINCSTENFRKTLQSVQRAVANKGILPVLSNVLVSTNGKSESKLKVVATDLEIGIEALLEANIEGDILTTLPARMLAEIVNKFPDKEMKLIFEENGVAKLLGEKSNYSLNTLSADDFPALPQPDEDNVVSLNVQEFSQAIRQTCFATATDASKTILTGIHISAKGKQVKLAATDGYRLAVRSLEVKKLPGTIDIIVPSRALIELERLLKQESDETFAMSCSGNQVVFPLDGKLLTSRLIDGKYPDYNKILPKNFERKAMIDTKLFYDAVDRISIMASEQTHVVSLNIQANEMVISAGAERGQGQESLEIQYQGEPILINFNVRYLSDALKIFLEFAPTLSFCLNGEVQPAVLQGLNDDSYVCMLMPVKP